MKLLLFGGTFNPVHLGHLFIAEDACLTLGYDTVVFVPAYKPAHKDISTEDNPAMRLEMLELATMGNKKFAVEPCEIERKGVSYTLDTIHYLYEKYDVDGKIGLLIGDDLVPGFKNWKHVDVLDTLVDIVIARRESADKYHFPWSHRYITNSIVEISSSDIRSRVANNMAFRYLVPEEVYDFIRAKGLYKTPYSSTKN